jgi:hypothetical protein
MTAGGRLPPAAPGTFLPFSRVFATDDDRVTLILLRAGVDLHACNMETMLSQQTIKQLCWQPSRGSMPMESSCAEIGGLISA